MAVDYVAVGADLSDGTMWYWDGTGWVVTTISGAAGGDLAGTYPNPTVASVSDAALSANVPLMTAGVLPAVDGSLLTNLPGGAVGHQGTVYAVVGALDGSGFFTPTPPAPILPSTGYLLIPAWSDDPSPGGVGLLISGAGLVFSTAGAVDSGKPVVVACVYI